LEGCLEQQCKKKEKKEKIKLKNEGTLADYRRIVYMWHPSKKIKKKKIKKLRHPG